MSKDRRAPASIDVFLFGPVLRSQTGITNFLVHVILIFLDHSKITTKELCGRTVEKGECSLEKCH